MSQLLDRLRELLPGRDVVLEPGESPEPISSRSLVMPRPEPLRLDLGGHHILLRCEGGSGTRREGGPPCWRLEEAASNGTTPRGSVRLHPEEQLLLGRDETRARVLLDLPPELPRRQLELRNRAGSLLLRNLAPDHQCSLARAPEGVGAGETAAARIERLARLCGLMGPITELLDPEAALAAVEQTLELLRDEPYRPKDGAGRPGGLVELPTGPTPLILGDLHGQLDNLLRVLCEDGWLDALLGGKAYLLLLGDTVHREEPEELEEMESSLLMLDFLCRLKHLLPDSFFWLRGNHESFDERVGKGGIPQGMLLRGAARALRGAAYADALDRLFDTLAYVAHSGDFIACHAGAPLRKTSRSDLVAIHDHLDIADELLWTRPQSSIRPGGFGKRDVLRLRDCLGVPPQTPLIVGHTPQAEEGVLWTDVAAIPNCHVIYDARSEGVPVFTRLRGEIVSLEYPSEPLLDLAREMDDRKRASSG